MSATSRRPGSRPTLTPGLSVRHADRAIAFYEEAFGARLASRMASPDGRVVMHAELAVGNARFFLGEEAPSEGAQSPRALGGYTTAFYLYVPDVDRSYRKALAAGARSVRPPADRYWGDRTARVDDPFGHGWELATRVEELTPEELGRRAAAWSARHALALVAAPGEGP
jgi:PhnB protein